MASFAVKLRQQPKSTSCTVRSPEENVGGIVVRTAFAPRFRLPSLRRPSPYHCPCCTRGIRKGWSIARRCRWLQLGVIRKVEGKNRYKTPKSQSTSSRSSGVGRRKEQKEREQSRSRVHRSCRRISQRPGEVAARSSCGTHDRAWTRTKIDGDDPSALKSSEGGRCPWRDRDDATAAPWLPLHVHPDQTKLQRLIGSDERESNKGGSWRIRCHRRAGIVVKPDVAAAPRSAVDAGDVAHVVVVVVVEEEREDGRDRCRAHESSALAVDPTMEVDDIDGGVVARNGTTLMTAEDAFVDKKIGASLPRRIVVGRRDRRPVPGDAVGTAGIRGIRVQAVGAISRQA